MSYHLGYPISAQSKLLEKSVATKWHNRGQIDEHSIVNCAVLHH